MTAKIKNPFVVGGYVSAEYFCDREAETAELVGSMHNRLNTVIVSPRRMGKSGLIAHCFHQKEIQKEYYTFFIDIYATGSLKELVFFLGKQIFEELKSKGRKFAEQFFAVIGSLRPAFKLDPVTGSPVFDMGIGEIRQPLLSLEEIFNYLESADKPCVVAIDEFQQIEKYPEKNMEATLRTYIQRCKNTTFVFCGSQRYLMQNIFFSASRPFYQSASFMNLAPIGLEPYRKFVRRHFDHAGKGMPDECFDRIYHLLEGHTWYMQMILNRIYDQLDEGEEATVAGIDAVLRRTLESNRVVYQSMVSMLPERQKEVLIAIAKDGKATEITSADFIKKHGLYSSSSVQSAARLLLEKEFVTREEVAYQVYDRFFGLWLAETYGTGYNL